MSEYLENVGRKEQYKRQYLTQRQKCEALRDAVRSALPIAENIDTLDVKKALALMVSLDQEKDELGEIVEMLDTLKKTYGV